jgi:hypothetical protein
MKLKISKTKDKKKKKTHQNLRVCLKLCRDEIELILKLKINYGPN